jgi:hypothetical protein
MRFAPVGFQNVYDTKFTFTLNEVIDPSPKVIVAGGRAAVPLTQGYVAFSLNGGVANTWNVFDSTTVLEYDPTYLTITKGYWKSASISSDGKYMFAASGWEGFNGDAGDFYPVGPYQGKIYYSNNGGLTWYPSSYTLPSGYNINWNKLRCSNSGQIVVAVGLYFTFDNSGNAVYSKKTFMSQNYGVSFTEVLYNVDSSPIPGNSCAISLTGQYVSVTTDTGVFSSSDYGQTWTFVADPNTTNKKCTGIAMTPDGVYRVLTCKTARTLWWSNDYGATWNIMDLDTFYLPSDNGAVAIMGYGTESVKKVIVGLDQRNLPGSAVVRLYYSNSSTGPTLWNYQDLYSYYFSSVRTKFTGVGVSLSGKYMYGVNYNADRYRISTDGGNSFSEIAPGINQPFEDIDVK